MPSTMQRIFKNRRGSDAKRSNHPAHSLISYICLPLSSAFNVTKSLLDSKARIIPSISAPRPLSSSSMTTVKEDQLHFINSPPPERSPISRLSYPLSQGGPSILSTTRQSSDDASRYPVPVCPSRHAPEIGQSSTTVPAPTESELTKLIRRGEKNPPRLVPDTNIGRDSYHSVKMGDEINGRYHPHSFSFSTALYSDKTESGPIPRQPVNPSYPGGRTRRYGMVGSPPTFKIVDGMPIFTFTSTEAVTSSPPMLRSVSLFIFTIFSPSHVISHSSRLFRKKGRRRLMHGERLFLTANLHPEMWLGTSPRLGV